MKYVVSGYIGFNNFGDELIARTLVQKLKDKGAERITLISSNPVKTSELHNVESCGMLNFILPLLKSDCLISGGGSLLQDVTSIKSLIYYLLVIYSALILRKKVIIFAQGIGPINSKIGQILTKFALKNAYKISVRDKNSQNLLESWNINSELVKDPALELDLPSKNKKGIVGIQLRDFKYVNDEFLEKLSNTVIKFFPDKQIELLSLQDSVDLELCGKFAELLKQKDFKSIRIISDCNIDEIIEHISDLEYLISMRFHSGVVGIKSGVKTLLINYDPKIKSLAEEYNLPVINFSDENFSVSFENLISF